MTRKEVQARYYQKHKDHVNAKTKAYRLSRKGKLTWTYLNMRQRVEGRNAKSHAYENMSILPRDEFIAWSLTDSAYNGLYDVWVASNYDKRVTPSIDRIDSTVGYVPGNLRWITLSANSKLGCASRWAA